MKNVAELYRRAQEKQARKAQRSGNQAPGTTVRVSGEAYDVLKRWKAEETPFSVLSYGEIVEQLIMKGDEPLRREVAEEAKKLGSAAPQSPQAQ